MSNNQNAELELVGCPECDAPAEVVDRFELPSTSGPVEHVKVRCLHRHWFTMAAANLTAQAPAAGRTGTWTGEEQTRWNRAA